MLPRISKAASVKVSLNDIFTVHSVQLCNGNLFPTTFHPVSSVVTYHCPLCPQTDQEVLNLDLCPGVLPFSLQLSRFRLSLIFLVSLAFSLRPPYLDLLPYWPRKQGARCSFSQRKPSSTGRRLFGVASRSCSLR